MVWGILLYAFVGGFVVGAVKTGFHRAGVALARAEIDTFLELHRALQNKPNAVATVRRLAAARGVRDRTRHCEVECEPNCRCTQFRAYRTPRVLRNAALSGSFSTDAAVCAEAQAKPASSGTVVQRTTEEELVKAVSKIRSVDKAVDQLREIDEALAESNSEVVSIAEETLERLLPEYPQIRTLTCALRALR